MFWIHKGYLIVKILCEMFVLKISGIQNLSNHICTLSHWHSQGKSLYSYTSKVLVSYKCIKLDHQMDYIPAGFLFVLAQIDLGRHLLESQSHLFNGSSICFAGWVTCHKFNFLQILLDLFHDILNTCLIKTNKYHCKSLSTKPWRKTYKRLDTKNIMVF